MSIDSYRLRSGGSRRRAADAPPHRTRPRRGRGRRSAETLFPDGLHPGSDGAGREDSARDRRFHVRRARRRRGPRACVTVLLPVRGTGAANPRNARHSDSGPVDDSRAHARRRCASAGRHQLSDGAAARTAARRGRSARRSAPTARSPGVGNTAGYVCRTTVRVAGIPGSGAKRVEGLASAAHRRTPQEETVAAGTSL